MPFKSEAQRGFLWANHPEIARRWEKEGRTKAIKRRLSNENPKK
jgi:hypothetical protein